MAMFEDADPYNRGAITYEALKNQLEKHGGLLENLSIRQVKAFLFLDGFGFIYFFRSTNFIRSFYSCLTINFYDISCINPACHFPFSREIKFHLKLFAPFSPIISYYKFIIK